MTADTRVSPTPDLDTQGYWAATAAGYLAIQRCTQCNQVQHFPSAICSSCWSFDLEFEKVSGRGTVYSFVTIHHVTSPGYSARAPYVVAWIAIAEQPDVRLLGVVASARTVAIGDEVVACFPASPDGFVVPEFELSEDK